MNGSWQRTEDASSEPVTVAEVKEHLKISGSAEDTWLGAAITAARQSIEHEQNRAHLEQSWEWVRETFESCIYLPVTPVQSVDSISYLDENGDEQTVDESVYVVRTGRRAVISLAAGQSWPSPARRPDAITITWTAGYANAAAVPGFTKMAIMQLVGHMYNHRETVVVGTSVTEIPLGLQYLIAKDAAAAV